jgi:hypothetical protein
LAPAQYGRYGLGGDGVAMAGHCSFLCVAVSSRAQRSAADTVTIEWKTDKNRAALQTWERAR